MTRKEIWKTLKIGKDPPRHRKTFAARGRKGFTFDGCQRLRCERPDSLGQPKRGRKGCQTAYENVWAISLENRHKFHCSNTFHVRQQNCAGCGQGYYLRAEKIAVTTDGKRLISLGSDLRIWEVSTGSQCRVIPWQLPHYNKPMDLAANNRWLAVANGPSDEGGSVSILDIYTGRELHTFKGHLGSVNQIAFSHNVKLLATAGDDTTTVVWDLAAMARQPTPAAKPLTEKELSKNWTVLSGQDAAGALEALSRLIDDPARSVPFAKKQLAKAQPFAEETIEKLIANLDADVFNQREEASKNLAKLGWTAEPAMQKALAKTSSAEVKVRLERLLANLPEEKFDLITVFAARVTELLERVGTSEAHDLLTELAKGPPSARLTQEAGDSIKRLEKKSTNRR